MGASYDCVVVGSGPGGAEVAREMARAGATVLVAERGGAEPLTGRARQTLRELCWPGRSLYRTGSVAVMRGVTLGGSSMYFFGSAWEPPHEVLGAHGLDLREDTEALRRELRPAPLPRDLLGPRAGRLLDTAQAMGLDWRPIPKFVDQHRLRRDGLGAWGAARWNARAFVEQARDAGARVLTGAEVTRVVTRAGAATGVEIRAGRRRRVVDADLVVVAAGGLGTPRILRASGIARAGRDFFYDPVLAVSGAVDGLDAGPEPPMLAALDRLDGEDYMLTDLCRPRWLHNIFTVAAGRPDRALSYRSTLTVMVKARDGLSGEMTDRGLAKPLTAADRAVLARGAVAAREILDHAGARSIVEAGHVAVHPGGTAKVGDVVDTDLQSEIRGLYVADASVIPCEWGIPPTFTVLALARRLARHLGAAPSTATSEPSTPSGTG